MKVGLKAWCSSWGLVAGVSNVFPNYFGFSGLPESCEVVWDAAQVQGAEKEATRAQLCQLHQLNTLLALHIYIIYRGHLHVSIYILVGTLILNS